jgi:hypothetical protein
MALTDWMTWRIVPRKLESQPNQVISRMSGFRVYEALGTEKKTQRLERMAAIAISRPRNEKQQRDSILFKASVVTLRTLSSGCFLSTGSTPPTASIMRNLPFAMGIARNNNTDQKNENPIQ